MISLDEICSSELCPPPPTPHPLLSGNKRQPNCILLRVHGVRWEGAHEAKSPGCRQLAGAVILSRKVTFPVSMNYSYILVRDMV